MSEISNYKKNIEEFISLMYGATVEKVVYLEELNPEFSQQNLPFKFKYCHSIVFITNRGNFSITTSQTSMGYDTFWIERLPNEVIGTTENVLKSNVTSVKVESNYEFPHKILIELESSILVLYAAELYVEMSGLRKVLNDEMILVFEKSHDAALFEAFDGGT